MPFCRRKLSRFGICSRSDGTFGLSRRRCTLSNWIWMRCLIPLPKLQPAAWAVLEPALIIPPTTSSDAAMTADERNLPMDFLLDFVQTTGRGNGREGDRRGGD